MDLSLLDGQQSDQPYALYLFVCFSSGLGGHILFSLISFSKGICGEIRNEWFTVATRSDLHHLYSGARASPLMWPNIKPQPQSKDKKAESEWENTTGNSDIPKKTPKSFGRECSATAARQRATGMFMNQTLEQG